MKAAFFWSRTSYFRVDILTMREEERMKDYWVKAGSILKSARFDQDDYKKTDQGIEKTDDCGRIGRVAWELQERLYANGTRAVLIVLQGMDASGKDGTIKYVMSGVNPQGCKVASFKGRLCRT